MAVALDSNVALTSADAAVPLATQLREGTKNPTPWQKILALLAAF